MARIVLVIPCFNEAGRLPEAAFRDFALLDHELHLLFVDDGSTDDTARELASLCAQAPSRLRFIRLDRNRGKAEAVRRGVQDALASAPAYVGYWDADLATPLEEVPRFARVLDQRPEIDAVLGSRVQMLGRHIERKGYRHAYGRVFATAVAQMLTLPVYDTQCGAKMFRVTEELAQVFSEPFASRWVFDVEILARFIALWEPRGIDTASRIYELPLDRWEHVEGSKIGARDAAMAFVDLGRIGQRYRGALTSRRQHPTG